jgi:hypothetical protein
VYVGEKGLLDAPKSGGFWSISTAETYGSLMVVVDLFQLERRVGVLGAARAVAHCIGEDMAG